MLSGQQISDATPFKLNPLGFRYLGIRIARSFKSLYSENFSPLLTEIKTDFPRWSSLPLSLIGRINTVKMSVLPKFLFLFQCLPIFLPKSFFFFKTVDSIICHFLWNGKTPKVKQKILHNCKFFGGLSLPNFQLYYWAANIAKIIFWSKPNDVPWFQLEAQSPILSVCFTNWPSDCQPLWPHLQPCGHCHAQDMVSIQKTV